MIIDEIKALLARALSEQRRQALTGQQLKALYAGLSNAQWDTLAGYFLAHDAKELGNYQINGVKTVIYNQALSEVNAITADGNITAAEIASLLGPLA